LRQTFFGIAASTRLMTEKDREGLSVSAWEKDVRSDKFTYT
jgi:hypothetical protein